MCEHLPRPSSFSLVTAAPDSRPCRTRTRTLLDVSSSLVGPVASVTLRCRFPQGRRVGPLMPPDICVRLTPPPRPHPTSCAHRLALLHHGHATTQMCRAQRDEDVAHLCTSSRSTGAKGPATPVMHAVVSRKWHVVTIRQRTATVWPQHHTTVDIGILYVDR